jgi:hypothetical protein
MAALCCSDTVTRRIASMFMQLEQRLRPLSPREERRGGRGRIDVIKQISGNRRFRGNAEC